MNPAPNLMSPEARKNPYPLYAALRRGPIRPIEPGGLWAVSRYEDVLAVMKDPKRFSSEGLAMGFRPPWLERRNRTAESLVMKDPPQHARLRGRVSRAFSQQAIARLEPRIRALAEELAERAVRMREVDFVAEFSMRLPVGVLGLLFGLDPEKHLQLKAWADDLLSIPGTFSPPPRAEEIRASLTAMERCFEALIDEKASTPGEDLVSDLLQPGEDGVTLTRDEVLAFLFALLPAGVETTVHLMSNALVVLSQHREVLAEVLRDRSRVATVVEEVLRYEAPGQTSLRLVTEDTTVSGVTLPKGAVAVVLLGSALRDEQVFPDGERFRLDRDRPSHLAFGHGIHYCLGALLARLEARLGLEALFARIRDVSVLDEEVAWAPSLIARGPASLRVRFEPK